MGARRGRVSTSVHGAVASVDDSPSRTSLTCMEPLFDTVVAAEADLISMIAFTMMLIGGAIGVIGLSGLGAIGLMPARRRS